MRHSRLRFESLEPRVVLDSTGLVINEFAAVNSGPLLDAYGDSSDWIEIYNPTTLPVVLDGWHLTDSDADLEKWEFPEGSGTLGDGEYLVVCASGRDELKDGEFHTNFKLSGSGEYLALVEPDGQTLASAYAPEFPEQYRNFSYGLAQNVTTLVPEGAKQTYHIPSAADAGLADAWTEIMFDDSSWATHTQTPPVVVTEVSTGADDGFELQNLSGQAVDTSGWVVVLNNGTGGPNEIHTPLQLPNTLDADEVFFRTDDDDDVEHFFGENIIWSRSGNGWIAILDAEGAIADLVVWGYETSEIAALDVDADGIRLTSASFGKAFGEPVIANPSRKATLQRSGNSDHDTAIDFQWIEPESLDEQNANLNAPFPVDRRTGIGFDTNPPDFTGHIGIDVESTMHDVNASLWTRVPFYVDNPTFLDTLRLRMKYNDGFVAYLNGQEVARRNAPEEIAWDSSAIGSRTVADSLSHEEIDITEYLGSVVAGDNVLAIVGLNQSAADGNFLIEPDLLATGPRYFAEPTPGAINTPGQAEFVEDTKFSVDRGFYEEPFTVTIRTDTPGAVIRYTTDGSEPTEENGILYTNPILIDRTTTLRAVGFKDGFYPTNVDTQTYIFLHDVVSQDRQATLNAGFPDRWGSFSNIDYGMDPDVIGQFDEDGNSLGGDRFGGRYSATIIEDLQSLPTMSITANIDDLFGTQGIYTNSTAHGIAWERAASAELIHPDGTEGFQVNAGLRIQGGYFRQNNATRKHSFRLLFKGDYGPTKLRFPLFGEDGDAVTRFDTITLRAGANDGYSWNAARLTEQYTRDEFGRSLQRATGNPASHGTFVHLYINGFYWGLYNPVERPDHSFSASYFGGDKETYDSINSGTSTNGDKAAWNAMISATQSAASSNTAYMRLQGKKLDGTPDPDNPALLDVQQYVDYLMVNVWGGNWDWPWKNWWASRDQTDASDGFRFFSWDYENTMGNNRSRSDLNKNALNNNFSSAGQPHQSLKQNAEYRMLFADRIHRAFFNDGVLEPINLIPRYQELADTVQQAIVAESARWGDQHFSTPLTQAEWYDERDWILDYYLPRRSDIVLQQFMDKGLYPDITAPSFSQHGGEVGEGFQLTIDAPEGTIYYTLDGSDPRLLGGNVSTTATAYDGAPVVLDDPILVKSRVWKDGEWSALNEAQFFIGTPANTENLAITEINYHPHDPNDADVGIAPEIVAADFEFIELQNISEEIVDLTDVRFTEGVQFDFNDGTITRLEPGQRVVVVADMAAFTVRYGTGIAGKPITILGEFLGQLDDSGDQLVLQDNQGETLFDFAYNDSSSWPGRADGKGASLELSNPTSVPLTTPERDDFLQVGANWRSSTEFGGSPGGAGIGPITDVVINEVLTHTDPPLVDSIEIHNTTGETIDIGGWYLSDEWGVVGVDVYKKFRIPDNTTISAGGYLIFDEHDFNASADPAAPGEFALNGAHGDDVWLMATDTDGRLSRFVDHVDFDAAANGESFGRYFDDQGDEHFVPMKTRTLGTENSEPRVGPVIISEIMYRPADPDGIGGVDTDDIEFIELVNPTHEMIDLDDWRIRAGVSFNFDPGTRIGPHETLVVLPFNPRKSGNEDRWAVFCNEYDLDINTLDGFVGGYSGSLSNEGETLRLRRPDGPPVEEPDFTPRLIEDEVDYGIVAPWPDSPATTGESLHRLGLSAWGHDAASWEAAAPSPGVSPLTSMMPSAEVVGRHIFYNNSGYDGRDVAANANDDQAIATDKEALLPGQQAALANYTSYSRGINGIMIDIADLADSALVDADDFILKTGNDDTPDDWAAGPAPREIVVRPGEGIDGSDRVTITFDDGEILGTWLQVRVFASPATGLHSDDVFYFGNAPGETGDSVDAAMVTQADEILARNHLRGLADLTTLDDRYDFNRDQLVNVADRIIARNNRTSLATSLRLITPSAADLLMAETSGGNDVDDLASPQWIADYGSDGSKQEGSESTLSRELAIDALLRWYWGE